LSEEQLETELNHPRRAGFEDTPEARRSQIVHRQGEVGVVSHVEALGAKLQPRALIEGEVLEQGDVEVAHAGSARDVAAGVAETARLGRRIQAAEGPRQYPLLDGRIARVRVAHQVRPAREETGDLR